MPIWLTLCLYVLESAGRLMALLFPVPFPLIHPSAVLSVTETLSLTGNGHNCFLAGARSVRRLE